MQSLDDEVEGLEDDLFSPASPMDLQVQKRSFELRKSLVILRRVVLPMREVLNTMMRRDLQHVDDDLMPYYQDVYDHVLRATEWTESLRDLVTTILETNLTCSGQPRRRPSPRRSPRGPRSSRCRRSSPEFLRHERTVSSFSDHIGFLVATVIMLGSGVLLYWIFRRNDWLLSPGLILLTCGPGAPLG